MPARFSRSALVTTSCEMYETVRCTMQDPRGRRTLKEALAYLKMPERSFRRRKDIAELHTLDPDKLDRQIESIIRAGERVGLERQHTLCRLALKQRAMRELRAQAAAFGKLI